MYKSYSTVGPPAKLVEAEVKGVLDDERHDAPLRNEVRELRGERRQDLLAVRPLVRLEAARVLNSQEVGVRPVRIVFSPLVWSHTSRKNRASTKQDGPETAHAIAYRDGLLHQGSTRAFRQVWICARLKKKIYNIKPTGLAAHVGRKHSIESIRQR